MLTDQKRKKAYRAIILTQCFGMLTYFLFSNGFYLNYFTKLGFSSAAFALLVSLPWLLGGFLLLPFAFLSDRLGKLKLALIGQVGMMISVLVMMMAGWGGEQLALPLAVTALLIYCFGISVQSSNWFALLNPIIPADFRGRFFGRLRVTFLTVNVLFTLLISGVLKLTQSMTAFQLLLGIVLIAHILRYRTYARIPELESEAAETGEKHSFRFAVKQVFAIPGYLAFNGYVFLITLFTAGVPIVFNLMQKDVFSFSESAIMAVGNFFLGGTILGCWLGGRAVDRFGTRAVLLVSHVAYAAVIIGMLSRHWFPWPLMIHVMLCAALFSMVSGVAGVAITSEALALIPERNKSLSTAVHMVLINWGAALAGLFIAWSLRGAIFEGQWSMLGEAFTDYDSILLLFALLVFLMLAAIGLVPKVVRKVQVLPGSYPRS